MEWILLITGILLVGMAYLDQLQTTIEHTGAGYLSSRLGAFLWRVFLFISGRDGKKSFLDAAGLIIVSSLILTWIIMIWVGFTLIFNFQADSITQTTTEIPATPLEKFYYTGYTLSTLGNGDFKAGNNVWRILTVIISISGLLIITLSITYLLPLLSAVTNKRKICAYISFLGRNPEELIINGWNGKDLSNLNQHFNRLAWEILDLKEKHLLYPVLHYFHSTESRFATPITLTILDEAISIIKGSTFLQQRVDPVVLKILRNSINEYLDILEGTYIYTSGEMPIISDFRILKQQLGIDTTPITDYFESLGERRMLLNGMVEADGWTWEDIREAE